MKWTLMLILCAVFIACSKEKDPDIQNFPGLMEIPAGFPNVDAPDDNLFTQARWELGKRLFYDNVMSSDSSLNCGSCHKATLAFSDDVSLSKGVEGRLTVANAPSLANVAYHPYYTRAGGMATLEMHVLVPVQEHNEFDFNMLLISERLKKDPSYVQMSQSAYGRDPDPFVITRSIACFERSLISGNSPYDSYNSGLDDAELPNEVKRGMELFFSNKTNCSTCHSDFNFTNYAFENNGLYLQYADEGRFRLTGIESDRALFKVPSLRNVALTGPYMHDGMMKTLGDVIAHYQSGGQDHPHKSLLIRPLQLSSQERQDLEAFLRSLTDKSFIANPSFQQ